MLLDSTDNLFVGY